MKLGIILNAAEAQSEMNKTLSNARSAIVDGVTEATTEAKEGLREMTRGAFKGNSLPNTWRSKLYGKDSFNPAGLVWSKAPKLMQTFSKGTLIQSSDGWYLAIPTENCPKTYGGKRVTPSNWPKEVYGPLTFVWRGNEGKPSMLVALDAPSAREVSYERSRLGRQIRGGKSTRTKGKLDLSKAVMFILEKQVRLDKRIDPEKVIQKAGNALPQRITARLKGAKE